MAADKFYSSKPATSHAVIAAGFKKLAEECQQHKAKTAWLVIPQKSNLDGFISEVIGDPAATALTKGNLVSLCEGCQLRLFTDRALPGRGDGNPILVCYPDMKMMNKLDELQNVPSIIVLPWTLASVQNWIDANGPVDIFGKDAPQAKTITNPVVEKALEDLYLRVRATGVSHPSDKYSTIELFKLLRAGGEKYEAAEVRAWLVQKGLAPRHADNVAQIAADPAKFKVAVGLHYPWADDILEQWREP